MVEDQLSHHLVRTACAPAGSSGHAVTNSVGIVFLTCCLARHESLPDPGCERLRMAPETKAAAGIRSRGELENWRERRKCVDAAKRLNCHRLRVRTISSDRRSMLEPTATIRLGSIQRAAKDGSIILADSSVSELGDQTKEDADKNPREGQSCGRPQLKRGRASRRGRQSAANLAAQPHPRHQPANVIRANSSFRWSQNSVSPHHAPRAKLLLDPVAGQPEPSLFTNETVLPFKRQLG